MFLLPVTKLVLRSCDVRKCLDDVSLANIAPIAVRVELGVLGAKQRTLVESAGQLIINARGAKSTRDHRWQKPNVRLVLRRMLRGRFIQDICQAQPHYTAIDLTVRSLSGRVCVSFLECYPPKSFGLSWCPFIILHLSSNLSRTK